MTHNVEIDGHKVLGFDTGIDARAFAQAKFSQFIAEPGLIVRLGGGSNGGVELWKASGVREVPAAGRSAAGNPTMMVWGPPVEGDRLDFVLNNSPQEGVLAAISVWIQAILALKDHSQQPPLWPCAAVISREPPQVFFAPSSLTRLCTMGNDESVRISGGEWYVHPDLKGMNAAAFTAAAMLYRTFAGTPPFAAQDSMLLHQDIREGNFLPIRFAVPGLNERLAFLVQYALSPIDKKVNKFDIGNFAVNELATGALAAGKLVNSEIAWSNTIKGESLLCEMLEILQKSAPFIQPLPEEERLPLEKEKAQFIKANAASVNAKRFVARNTGLLLGIIGAVVAAVIIIVSIVHSRSQLPTTAGMEPVQVIESYYNAMGELNHQLMEACVIRGVGKNDIRMVVNLFVITKVRQSNEFRSPLSVVSARDWQEGIAAVSPSSQIFGVTDLTIKLLAEGGDEARRYQADYILWVPATGDGMSPEFTENPSPESYIRSDTLTLIRKKGNWRIAEIQRAMGNE